MMKTNVDGIELHWKWINVVLWCHTCARRIRRADASVFGRHWAERRLDDSWLACKTPRVFVQVCCALIEGYERGMKRDEGNKSSQERMIKAWCFLRGRVEIGHICQPGGCHRVCACIHKCVKVSSPAMFASCPVVNDKYLNLGKLCLRVSPLYILQWKTESVYRIWNFGRIIRFGTSAIY